MSTDQRSTNMRRMIPSARTKSMVPNDGKKVYRAVVINDHELKALHLDSGKTNVSNDPWVNQQYTLSNVASLRGIKFAPPCCSQKFFKGPSSSP